MFFMFIDITATTKRLEQSISSNKATSFQKVSTVFSWAAFYERIRMQKMCIPHDSQNKCCCSSRSYDIYSLEFII